MKEVAISSPEIKLDSFLKWAGLVETGGVAKALIQDGQILVNGQLETRRSRKLLLGDVVTVPGRGEFRVTAANQPS